MSSALILLISLVALLLLSVPVAFSVGSAAILMLFFIGNTNLMIVSQRIFQGMNAFPFLAIPFFILAGNIMASGGISRRLINFCSALVGRTNGGLAIVSIVSCMFFGAVCGSAIATCAAVGAIMLPAMAQKGYDKNFTAATISTASITGMLIPPSVQLVVYCVLVGASVGKAFIAGVVPGILFGLGCIFVAYFVSKKHHYREERAYSAGEIFKAFLDASLALFMPVIILGGIFSGVFTATESAAVAVIYGLIVGVFVYREISPQELAKIFLRSAMMASGILLILGCANLFGMLLMRERIPEMLANFFISVSSNKYIFLILVNFLFLILGMFMEMGAATIIMVPLLLPVVKHFNIDLVHFGVITTVNLGLGLLTPPFGISLFLICEMTGAELQNVLKKLVPYFLVSVATLALVTFVPQLSLFLTRFMK